MLAVAVCEGFLRAVSDSVEAVGAWWIPSPRRGLDRREPGAVSSTIRIQFHVALSDDGRPPPMPSAQIPSEREIEKAALRTQATLAAVIPASVSKPPGPPSPPPLPPPNEIADSAPVYIRIGFKKGEAAVNLSFASSIPKKNKWGPGWDDRQYDKSDPDGFGR